MSMGPEFNLCDGRLILVMYRVRIFRYFLRIPPFPDFYVIYTLDVPPPLFHKILLLIHLFYFIYVTFSAKIGRLVSTGFSCDL